MKYLNLNAMDAKFYAKYARGIHRHCSILVANKYKRFGENEVLEFKRNGREVLREVRKVENSKHCVHCEIYCANCGSKY